MNNTKIPEQHHTLVLFGDFSIFSQSAIVMSVPSFSEYTKRSSLYTVTLSTTACRSFSSNSMGGAGVSSSSVSSKAYRRWIRTRLPFGCAVR